MPIPRDNEGAVPVVGPDAEVPLLGKVLHRLEVGLAEELVVEDAFGEGEPVALLLPCY